MYRRVCQAAALVAVVGLAWPSLAADVGGVPSAPTFTVIEPNVSRWEVRGGILASVWGPERGDANINAELIAPKLFRWEGLADILLPRARIGVMGNLSGGTSYIDGGGMWTVAYGQLFADVFVGGALHDGQTNGHYTDPTRNKMGCGALYHVGTDIGYQVTADWSVMATLDHVSNGTGFLSDCRQNDGVTAVGFRLGRAF